MFKAVLFICAQTLVIQSIAGQCFGARISSLTAAPAACPSAGAAYGAAGRYAGPLSYDAATVPSSNGGGLGVASTSSFQPNGLSVISENAIEGPLAVAGALPFLGTVALEGILPTAGAGSVNFAAGNGAVAILEEAGAGPFGAGPFAVDAYGYGPYGYGAGPYAGNNAAAAANNAAIAVNNAAAAGSGPFGVGPLSAAGPFGVGPFGNGPFGAANAYDAAASVPASNGGGLGVSSGSAIPPNGVAVHSENAYEGPLAVGGALPFLGTVALEGALPTAGAGAVNFAAGNGAVAILDEGASPYATDAYGYGALGYGAGLAAGPYGPRAGAYRAGCAALI